MSTPVEMWQTAAEGFDHRYRAITAAQWEAATPCSEWNVHELVTHAVGVQMSFGAPLGLTTPDGADWPTVRAAMDAVLAQPGATDGTGTHPAFGEVPKAMLLGIATNDMLIHTWDLSRAIGANEQLPDDLVSAAYQTLQQLPADVIRGPGRFAAPVDVDDGADMQTKMLAFAGRKP